MRWKRIGLVAAGVLVGAVVLGYFVFGVRPAVKPDSSLADIRIPPGFRITTFADDLGGSPVSYPGPNPGPRMMVLQGDTLFVTVPNQGRVVALPDRDRDGRADRAVTFIEGLRNPHGIGSSGGWLYVAEETRVVRVRDADGDLAADPGSLQVLVDGLPGGGGHFTRTLQIHNGSLYLSVGSSCNVCHEDNPWRAAIHRCGMDGTNCTPFARGLRNSVGFVFHPQTGAMYATDNGRDWLGDDLPPDELNRVEEGKNYGWPICYGKGVHDTDFDKNVYVRDPCADTVPSLVDLQAHSAPLGLAFYDGNQFPAEHRGYLFVAFHGSWNRGQPTGYKIVRVDMETLQVSDFATGWLQGSNVLGRPVDLIVAADGSMLVSDDNAGRIYRVSYVGA